MSRTSQKHRDFVAEPMSGKKVTDLPGIGDKSGGRLQNKGYGKASAVMGQFHVMNRNEERFTNWLKDTSGANNKQASDCYKSLSVWSDHFV